VVAEIAEKDELASEIYASDKKLLDQATDWSGISEMTYLQARDRA
jgi:TRAP-type mannitol/chloroaromatic compound transport system substrate-binding protein